jgi:putative FmdB family regulatory protein
MPTYDYKCNACKKQFDLFQSIMEDPKRKCPYCGKNALERLIGTGGAIIFKGSGFYQTDYRSESYKKAAESDKPAEAASSESKGDKKSETKPETKSESKAESKAASKSNESKPVAESKSKSKPEHKPDKKSKSKA